MFTITSLPVVPVVAVVVVFFFVESLATLANSDLKARRASRAESSGSARCPAAKHHEAPWSTTKHQDLPSISRRYQGDIKEISRICKRY
jgi:hypothetical protein